MIKRDFITRDCIQKKSKILFRLNLYRFFKSGCETLFFFSTASFASKKKLEKAPVLVMN